MPRPAQRSIVVASCLAAALLAPARAALAVPDEGFSVAAGFGLTASPESFLMRFYAPYRFENGLSLGPELHAGVKNHTTLVSAALGARYDFDFALGSDDVISEITPFVTGGLGLSYIEDGRKKPKGLRFSNDGTGFLMSFGFGVSYPLLDRLSLEAAVQFNVIPDGAGPHDADHFYFSWQIAGARYYF